jgi:hypothetical protein
MLDADAFGAAITIGIELERLSAAVAVEDTPDLPRSWSPEIAGDFAPESEKHAIERALAAATAERGKPRGCSASAVPLCIER